ncbi:MAG: hypothetical protein C0483_21385 [Pirellula sp.]|nr:hypothetical protein [Pirellula sp.]
MFGWLRKRPTDATAEPLSDAPSRRIVAEFYNDRRDFRGLIFERDDGTFSYYFESLMDLSDEPVWPIPEVWWEGNLRPLSGVYDSAETALAEAKRDAVWVQNGCSDVRSSGAEDGN